MLSEEKFCNAPFAGIILSKDVDLQGSTYGREASKKERKKAHPTFKDLDFLEMYPEGIYLQPEIHACLMDTIERDCRALESLKIMDYSLLLGIHIIDPDSSAEKKPDHPESGEESAGSGGESEEGWAGDERGGGGSGSRRPGMLERVGSIQQKQRLIAHSTALESITAEVDDAAMADLVDETETVDKMTTWGGIPAKNEKGDNLLIFIGNQFSLTVKKFQRVKILFFRKEFRFFTERDTASLKK